MLSISGVQQRELSYTCIHSFSSCSPVWVVTEYCAEFPVLYSTSLLIKYSSVYMPIPNSNYPSPTRFFCCAVVHLVRLELG